MEGFTALVHYLSDNPWKAVGVVGILLGIRYLLNRKSRLAREADEHLEHLREERGNYYNKIRPPG
jgi:hypothetical protein